MNDFILVFILGCSVIGIISGAIATWWINR